MGRLQHFFFLAFHSLKITVPIRLAYDQLARGAEVVVRGKRKSTPE